MSINNTSHQRRIRYLDNDLQMWFIVGLVALEIVLIAITMWILYGRLNEIVETQLYQIHFDESQPSLFMHLWREGVKLLGVFVLINIALLFLAKRFWSNRVKHILFSLNQLSNGIAMHDFTVEKIKETHPVLEHAQIWYQAENACRKSVRLELSTLVSTLPMDVATHEITCKKLEQIRAMI